MPNPADEIAKNIARNIIPFNAGQDIYGVYGPVENKALQVLRSLGLMPKPAPAQNEALPRIDPATGQVYWPENMQQIEPGDVEARKRQVWMNAQREQ